MISQRCPRCSSNRIRRGYRPTPLWSKFLFRYYLLCDKCNWEFTGFAVPGTVGTKSYKRPKKQSANDNDNAGKEKLESIDSDHKKKVRVKKRVKVKLKAK